VGSPSPTTLVGSGVTGLHGISPDGAHALYYSRMDAQTLVSDLYLTSTTTPGATTTLSSAESAGVFGDAFTADGSHVLYGTDVDTSTQTMTLDALSVGGGSPVALTTTGWVIWAATGAKVVFADHYAWSGTGPHADVRVVDTSKGEVATLVQSQADPDIFLSPAHDQVAYTYSLESGPQMGLYLADIP
jgi:hypothetical protein